MPIPSYPKILIVENELIIAADVLVQFSKLGCQMLGIHARAIDALKTIVANRPDLVIINVGLPGKLNGLAAARLMTQDYHLPLIFLSSHTDEDSLQGALALRPWAFIAKPFINEDLENALAYILTRLAQPLRELDYQNTCKLFFNGEVYRLKLPPPLED
ncbi:response regulator [Lewinella sp. LCG006]|uniref:response regulator n=1 Tax=Lewinella sp. LCG006 TaxID=3231911 RepID=UPI00345F6C9B